MLNLMQCIGHLGSDPEVRQLPGGDSVANFSVAMTEKWKDKQTGGRKEKTEWLRVSAFGKLADICGQYLRKGSQVYVSGQIQTRKWQDQAGNDRYTTELKCREMRMLGSREGNQGQGQGSGVQTPQRGAESVSGGGGDFDTGADLPFGPYAKHAEYLV